jgi:hypothetical protein
MASRAGENRRMSTEAEEDIVGNRYKATARSGCSRLRGLSVYSSGFLRSLISGSVKIACS